MMDVILFMLAASVALAAHVIFVIRDETGPLGRAVSLVCIPVLGLYVWANLRTTDVMTPLTWTGQAECGWPVAVAIGMAIYYATRGGAAGDPVRS